MEAFSKYDSMIILAMQLHLAIAVEGLFVKVFLVLCLRLQSQLRKLFLNRLTMDEKYDDNTGTACLQCELWLLLTGLHATARGPTFLEMHGWYKEQASRRLQILRPYAADDIRQICLPFGPEAEGMSTAFVQRSVELAERCRADSVLFVGQRVQV
jgi:hypothetical protein